MKILVTGATGNVGAYVIEELLKLDEKVVACGTDLNKIKNKFGDRVEVVKMDFTNHNTFKTALCEVDRVFLMRPPHLSKPQDLYPFIRAMRESSVRLVSFLSLMGIENNRIPPHYKIERYIEQVGLPYSHIRPGFFMQNLSGIHSVEIREQDKIFIPAGKSKTSFIDAADIGLAIATVLHQSETHKNTSFTITGSEALDYYQIARAFSKGLGRKITYENPGFFKYRNYYINQRKLEKTLVDVTIALYFMTRIGAAKRITQDFKKLTGKEPKTIHEFISENKKLFIS